MEQAPAVALLKGGAGGGSGPASRGTAPKGTAPSSGQVAEPPATSYWVKTEVNGKTVYIRPDLIDPLKVDGQGRTNVQRMEQGLAPLGPDGKPINLHHMTQSDKGAIAETTQTFHQQNSRVIHINPKTIPSGIDRAAFSDWRELYWMTRAQGLIVHTAD